MKRVVLETPYRGKTKAETNRNVRYARACMNDCLKRNEAPFASHLLYTQPGILNDRIPEERQKAIVAGHLWALRAEYTVVYIDLGISEGMKQGIEAAHASGRKIIRRRLKNFD